MGNDNVVVVRRIVLSLIVVAALGGFAISFAHTKSEDAPKYIDAAIEAVYPNAGDLDLRQARIGIDLRPGYAATLSLDGHALPEDQLERVDALQQVFYTPGPGKETGALAPGHHCAAADLWQVQRPADTHRTYSWCFEVH